MSCGWFSATGTFGNRALATGWGSFPIAKSSSMALTLSHSACLGPRHYWKEALGGPRWLLAGLLVLASLAGCTVGPDFQPPGPPQVADYLPGHDRQVGRIFVPRGDIPARWWEVFRSRHLNELIE